MGQGIVLGGVIFNSLVTLLGFAYLIGMMRQSQKDLTGHVNTLEGKVSEVDAKTNQNTSDIAHVQGHLGIGNVIGKSKGHHA